MIVIVASIVNIPFFVSGGTFVEYLLSTTLFTLFNKHVFVRHVTRDIKKNIEHGTCFKYGQSTNQHMEIFFPRSHRSSLHVPVLFYFHGGAFNIGDKDFGLGISKWVSEHGIIGITVGYALAGHKRWKGTQTAVEDAINAVEYVLTKADELGVDADQIVLAGDSAGGAIALMTPQLLMNTTSIAAVVCSWPMTTFNAKNFIPLKKYGNWLETSQESVRMSPSLFVASDDPDPQLKIKQLLSNLGIFGRRARGWLTSKSLYDPKEFVIDIGAGLPDTLLLCAENDRVTPYKQQKMFAERIDQQSNVEIALFEDCDHGEGAVFSSEGRRQCYKFSEKTYQCRALQQRIGRVR